MGTKEETNEKVVAAKTIQKNIDTHTSNPKQKRANQNDLIPIAAIDSDQTTHDLDTVGLRICQIIAPVSLCALYVVVLVKILEQNVYKSSSSIASAWRGLGLPAEQSDTFSDVLVSNIIIVGVFLGLIVLVSVLVLFIFYMEWHSCLQYYFYLPSLIMMIILTPYYFGEILISMNWFGLDLISLVVLTWNFSALGLIAIFGVYVYAPLYIQQFYLIHNSAILAVLILNALPGWAPWLLLVFLVFWDLFAVLAPIGPLNLLINMAEKEGVVDMPGLIYTTEYVQTGNNNQRMANNDHDDSLSRGSEDSDSGIPSAILPTVKETVSRPDTKQPANNQDKNKTIKAQKVDESQQQQQQQQTQPKQEDQEDKKRGSTRKRMEERGVNIGLGDFIFYSLFIGLTIRKQEESDFLAAIASLNAILLGLVLTLFILALTQRTLPALPISIGLGLIIGPVTIYMAPQLTNRLAYEQVFI